MTEEFRKMLTTMTPAEVRKEAQQLVDEGEHLQRQGRALFAYANVLEGGEAPPATSPGPKDAGKPSRETVANGSKARVTPTNKRPLILRLMEEHSPEREWSARQIYDALVEQQVIDPATTMPAIRVTLRRMAQRGEVAKVREGRFQLPAQTTERLTE
jgi:hypothetical protein